MQTIKTVLTGMLTATALSFLFPIASSAQILGHYETPIIAGQSFDAGVLVVENDYDFIYVTYLMNPGWTMTQTHLDVEFSAENFPYSKGGAVPGQFEFQAAHASAQSYTYAVPLTRFIENEVGNVAIAAHAVVSQIGANGKVIRTETAWGGDQRMPTKKWAWYLDYVIGSGLAGSGTEVDF